MHARLAYTNRIFLGLQQNQCFQKLDGLRLHSTSCDHEIKSFQTFSPTHPTLSDDSTRSSTWFFISFMLYTAIINFQATTIAIHLHMQWNLSSQTLQIKDTIEKTSIISTNILVPTGVTNTFLASEIGNPLY